MKTSTVCDLAVMAIEAVLRLELPQVDANQRRLLLKAGQRLMGVQLRAAEREHQREAAKQAAETPEAFEAMTVYSLNAAQLAHFNLGLRRNFDCFVEIINNRLWLVSEALDLGGPRFSIQLTADKTVSQTWTLAKLTTEEPLSSKL
jgi:hypothetical protein